MRFKEPAPHRPKRPKPHVAAEYQAKGEKEVAAELMRALKPQFQERLTKEAAA